MNAHPDFKLIPHPRGWTFEFNTGLGIFTHELMAGISDQIWVYEADGRAVVLSASPRFGYIGLEVYLEDELVGSVFDQSPLAAKLIDDGPDAAADYLFSNYI